MRSVYSELDLSGAFEVLHRALMLFRGSERREGTEVFAFASLGVPFARVQAKFTGFEFADHEKKMQSWLTKVGDKEVCITPHRYNE